MAHRYLNLDIERPDLPTMTEWYKRLCDRPAFRQHVGFPFGRNPAEWYVLEREGLSEGGS
jgi:glutathione S-transferase